jgi:hypothetical protein
LEQDAFFHSSKGTTPKRLVRGGLYHEIAVPLKGGVYRPVALALLAKAVATKPPPPVDRKGPIGRASMIDKDSLGIRRARTSLAGGGAMEAYGIPQNDVPVGAALCSMDRQGADVPSLQRDETTESEVGSHARSHVEVTVPPSPPDLGSVSRPCATSSHGRCLLISPQRSRGFQGC